MRAVAVGTVGEKQRKDDICVVTRKLDPLVSQLDKPVNRAIRPDLLSVPTASNSVSNLSTDGSSLEPLSSSAVVPPPVTTSSGPEDTSGVKLELNGTDDVKHDNQETAPARPEIERFVTAREDLITTPANEQVPEVSKIDQASATSAPPVVSENVQPVAKQTETPTTNGSTPENEKVVEPTGNGKADVAANGKAPDSSGDGHSLSSDKGPDSPGVSRTSTEKLHRVVPKIKNLLHHHK